MRRPRPRGIPALRLGGLSMLSFLRAPLPAAALAALVLIPLLYSGLYLWSFWDPFGRMDQLPVALVDEDRPVEVGGEELDAGGALADELVEGGDLDWNLVDAQEAEQGLREGRYYVSLRIPEDFSERLASPSRDDATPVPAMLEAHYDDSNGYIVRSLMRSAFTEVQNAAASSAIADYLDEIFLGFNDIHEATREAADGAAELADGAGTAKDGSGELASGASEAAAGSGDLSSGLGTLYSGSQELADGATSASDQVSAATDELDAIADTYIPLLRDNAPEIETAADAVSTAASNLSSALGDLPTGTRSRVADLQDDHQALQEYVTAHPELREDPALKEAVDGLLSSADEAVSQATAFDDYVQGHAADISDIAEQADTVSGIAADIADAAPTLADDAEAARDKVDALDAGLTELAQGSRDLRDGLADAYDGSADLGEGLSALEEGAVRLDDGIGELSDGSATLSDGLADGVEQVPTYDDASRAEHGDMMSSPVRLSSDIDNEAPDYGTGFAPFFLPLSLWVGAMVTYMVLPAVSGRALAANAPAWRIALANWSPALVIGVAQTLVMLAALRVGLGLDAARWPGLVGVLALTAATFTAVVYWANVRFNAAGRIVALVLLMLQLTSAGGTYPIETSHGFFQAIAPFLPMSWVVAATRHLISGGDLTVVWQACGVLGAYLAGALLLTWRSVAGRRVWTMARLHPDLKL
ncbi:YhgE/Pip domain-containing protein [Marinactinospora endophytica]